MKCSACGSRKVNTKPELNPRGVEARGEECRERAPLALGCLARMGRPLRRRSERPQTSHAHSFMGFLHMLDAPCRILGFHRVF